MKAIQVIEPKKMIMIEREVPSLKNSHDVLIKIKATGICGSDMHIYHGDSPVATYPRVVGHEIAGEVIDKGPDVTKVKVGDHVVLEPMIGCGECYACRNGRPNACATLTVRGCHIDGGFQEYYVIPEHAAYKIKKDIPWEIAAMVEPYTIADQVTWRADIKDGDYVFIIGAGPIGLCILEMAKLKNVVCIVSDYNDKRLSLAQSLGADYIINPSTCDPYEEVLRITEGMGANVTIDAVCLPKTFEEAVKVTSVAGRVMCLGFTKDISEIAQINITLKELDIRGSRHQTYKFPHVVDLFNKGRLNPSLLISHVIEFTEYERALDLIENHPQEVCKVVLVFN